MRRALDVRNCQGFLTDIYISSRYNHIPLTAILIFDQNTETIMEIQPNLFSIYKDLDGLWRWTLYQEEKRPIATSPTGYASQLECAYQAGMVMPVAWAANGFIWDAEQGKWFSVGNLVN